MLTKTERHDFHNAIAAGFWITGKPGAWHAGFGRGSDAAVFPTSHATKDAARREALAVFLAPRTHDSGDADETPPRAGFEVETDAGEGCTRSSFLDANPDLDRETIAESQTPNHNHCRKKESAHESGFPRHRDHGYGPEARHHPRSHDVPLRGRAMNMRPFWRYYGGKFRAAPRYPKPLHSTIIEPFAGAAGYAMRYPDRNVVLVERYPIVAEIWRYLIAASSSEIRRIPLVDSVDDLPSWVPVGARYLIGFTMNDANVSPCRTLSIGKRRLRERGRVFEGWSEAKRELVAMQVERIRHWKIIEGDFTSAPSVEATWFVDPPYSSSAGRHYVHDEIDYPTLGEWCRTRTGQTIVCENAGATWLPFEPFAVLKPGVNGRGSDEVIWYREVTP